MPINGEELSKFLKDIENTIEQSPNKIIRLSKLFDKIWKDRLWPRNIEYKYTAYFGEFKRTFIDPYENLFFVLDEKDIINDSDKCILLTANMLNIIKRIMHAQLNYTILIEKLIELLEQKFLFLGIEDKHITPNKLLNLICNHSQYFELSPECYSLLHSMDQGATIDINKIVIKLNQHGLDSLNQPRTARQSVISTANMPTTYNTSNTTEHEERISSSTVEIASAPVPTLRSSGTASAYTFPGNSPASLATPKYPTQRLMGRNSYDNRRFLNRGRFIPLNSSASSLPQAVTAPIVSPILQPNSSTMSGIPSFPLTTLPPFSPLLPLPTPFLQPFMHNLLPRPYLGTIGYASPSTASLLSSQILPINTLQQASSSAQQGSIAQQSQAQQSNLTEPSLPQTNPVQSAASVQQHLAPSKLEQQNPSNQESLAIQSPANVEKQPESNTERKDDPSKLSPPPPYRGSDHKRLLSQDLRYTDAYQHDREFVPHYDRYRPYYRRNERERGSIEPGYRRSEINHRRYEPDPYRREETRAYNRSQDRKYSPNPNKR